MNNTPLRLLLISVACLLSIQKYGGVPTQTWTTFVQLAILTISLMCCLATLVYAKNLMQSRCYQRAYHLSVRQLSAVTKELLS